MVSKIIFISFRNRREDAHQHSNWKDECTASADCSGISSRLWKGTIRWTEQPVRAHHYGSGVPHEIIPTGLLFQAECNRKYPVYPVSSLAYESWFAVNRLMALPVLFDLLGPQFFHLLDKEGCLRPVAVNQEWVCSPKDIWQCLETFWSSRLEGDGGMFLESGGWRAGVLLKILPQDGPHNKELSDQFSDRSCLRSSLISLPTLGYLCNCRFSSRSKWKLAK